VGVHDADATSRPPKVTTPPTLRDCPPCPSRRT
jgi:hypothetical protein